MRPQLSKRELLGLAVLTCAVAVLSACGSSLPDRSLPTIDQAVLSGDAEPSYPLTRIMYGPINPDHSEARRLEIEQGQQQILVDCMLGAGFEYTPRPMSAFTYDAPADDASYLGWMDTYGFGITTRYFVQSQVAELVGEPDIEADERRGASFDPNQAYLESLSANERNAYDFALKGFTSSFRPQSAIEEALMERPDGCVGESQSWVEQQQGPNSDELLRDRLDSELAEMVERMQADTRLAEFDEQVRLCVAEQGLVWPGESELSVGFEPELAAIAATLANPEDNFGSLPLGQQALELLAELQAEELMLAQVVHDCGGGRRSRNRLAAAVSAAYEQQFVDQNANVLAEIATFAPD